MFTVTLLAAMPAAIVTTRDSADWWHAYSTLPTITMLLLLTVVSTLGAYLLMNRWQRHVGATAAGLIYCGEPIFASAFALFVPGIFSAWAALNYSNESVTAKLLG